MVASTYQFVRKHNPLVAVVVVGEFKIIFKTIKQIAVMPVVLISCNQPFPWKVRE